jgi:hypothetical protein
MSLAEKYNLNEYTPVKFIERDIYLEQFFKFDRIYSINYILKRDIVVTACSSIILKMLTKHLFKE